MAQVKQVTDGLGKNVSRFYGLETNIRTESNANKTPFDWHKRIDMKSGNYLGDLSGGKFDLIYRYLVKMGYSLAEPVKCGNVGTLKSVVIKGVEIRSNTYQIKDVTGWRGE